MGKCYSKNIFSVKEGAGAGAGAGGCPLSPAPETASADGATPPPSFASPGHSPYPGGASPLPPALASPPPGTQRRTLRWPFPPPSPAKPIMSAIFRLNGREKPKEGQGRDESTERPLDKRFGYAKNFAAKYELGKEVGQGHFGHTSCARVRKGELKGQSVAVKIIPKAKMTTVLAIEDVRREVKILKALSGHENLVKFHDACEDDNNVYIIMELCEGGELLQRILSSGGRYREDDAKLTVACILKVVAFCHLQGVVHRDLKPENFLFTTRDVDASMKLIDFGLSDFAKADQRLNDIVGSAYYVAPEVLRKSYNLEADMWSIGVIAYILLCGSRPFWARTETGIFRSVLRSHPNFDDAPWPTISSEAKDFVKRLLNKDSRKRMTAAQALTHPWIRCEDNDVPLDILIYKSVKSYIRATPLKRAILKALSKALPDDDLVYLRAQFRLLEPKNGLITHDNFKVALLKQATDAMKESRVPDILNAMESHSFKKMDFEEFCAAVISVHQLEALEGWERISSTAFEFFEEEGNRVTSVAELAQEMNLGPSTYSLFNDWIRDSDRKLSYLGYTKFLHGVTVRSGSNTRQQL